MKLIRATVICDGYAIFTDYISVNAAKEMEDAGFTVIRAKNN